MKGRAGTHPTACACTSGRAYADCCAPLHAGASAPSPEALMRSRYAAYALGLPAYILATTDPDGPAWEGDGPGGADAWRASIQRFSSGTRFDGLDILDAPTPLGATGTVTFRARLTQGGADATFAERSVFVHRGGNWRYHRGTRLRGTDAP
jgi:SEC-C motif-containing protein